MSPSAVAGQHRHPPIWIITAPSSNPCCFAPLFFLQFILSTESRVILLDPKSYHVTALLTSIFHLTQSKSLNSYHGQPNPRICYSFLSDLMSYYSPHPLSSSATLISSFSNTAGIFHLRALTCAAVPPRTLTPSSTPGSLSSLRPLLRCHRLRKGFPNYPTENCKTSPQAAEAHSVFLYHFIFPKAGLNIWPMVFFLCYTPII